VTVLIRWMLVLPAGVGAAWLSSWLVGLVWSGVVPELLPVAGTQLGTEILRFLEAVSSPASFVLVGARVAPAFHRQTAIALAVIFVGFLALAIVKLDQGSGIGHSLVTLTYALSASAAAYFGEHPGAVTEDRS